MNHWKYRGVTRSGVVVEGSLQGTRQGAIQQIRERHVELIDMRWDWRRASQSLRPLFPIHAKTWGDFFEDFANMYATGMTVGQSIQSLKDSVGDAGFSDVLHQLQGSLSQGVSLAESMQRTRRFPRIVGVTIKAGEDGGRLLETLQMLARYFRQYAQVEQRLKRALTYPCIVLAIVMGVALMLSLRVVPQLETMLPVEQGNAPVAQGLIAVSHWLRDHGDLLVLGLVFSLVGLGASHCKDTEALERWIYRVPLVGQLVKDVHLSFCFLNLAVLLKSGVPLLRAISTITTTYRGIASRHFVHCQSYMYGGLPLWEAMRRIDFFPPAVVFSVRRGEELVRLEESCYQLGEHLSARAANRVEKLIELVQPVVLLLAGLLLTGVAFSFVLPIYGSLAKVAGG